MPEPLIHFLNLQTLKQSTEHQGKSRIKYRLNNYTGEKNSNK